MFNFDKSLLQDYISPSQIQRCCNKRWGSSQWDIQRDSELKHGDIWFVGRMNLNLFLLLISNDRYMNESLTIVTSHADDPIDDELMSSLPPNVKHIFGVNTTSFSDKCTPIPYGLGPEESPVGISIERIKERDIDTKRSKMLLVNFRTGTHPERPPLYNALSLMASRCSWITMQSDRGLWGAGPEHHWWMDELVKHKFAVAPRGNGLDTHRMWECLYAKTIPIVKWHSAYRNFTDLPILFVDDWGVLSESFLEEKYQEMTNKEWNYEKLRASWWRKMILDKSNSLFENKPSMEHII